MAGSQTSDRCDEKTLSFNIESEDNRTRLQLRYEEFTELGKKYNSGEFREDADSMVINLMSYNMLSQFLLDNHRELYTRNDNRTLRWEFRWHLLFNEIQNEKPDILCMQEVEEKHLDEYYNQLLLMGYDYIYKKRTRKQVDGCAIYFNYSKFELDDYELVEYFNRGINCLDRDNVGLVARFKPRSSPEDLIVVATTHLLYNPRRHDIRLAQIQILLAEIDKLAYNKETKTYYPVILTGDFNEKPNSSVYRLITEGKFRYEGLSYKTLNATFDHTRMSRVLIPKWKGITDNCQYLKVVKAREADNKVYKGGLARNGSTNASAGVHTSASTTAVGAIALNHAIDIETENTANKSSSDEESFSDIEVIREESFSSGKLTHNLKFTSAYKNVKDDGSYEASTHHDTWITVDYIFYSLVENNETKKNSDGKLQLLSTLRLPTQSECRNQFKYLPNYGCGSDHLSLSAKFLLHLKVST